TSTSVGVPSNTLVADSSGMPRFHVLTIRLYPDWVSDPGPKSVPTYSVSRLRQATWLLASGKENPPGTNDFVVRSNSRTTCASEPPLEICTRQRWYSGGSGMAPSQTHATRSTLERESRSRTVSQPGRRVRYCARLVLRHSPRGWSGSFQKL